MRRKHAAASKLQQRNRHALFGQGREAGGVSDDDGTCLAVVVGMLAEVVLPIGVLGEVAIAVEVGGLFFKRGIEVWVDCAGLGLSGGREGKEGGEENEYWDEHVDGGGCSVSWEDEGQGTDVRGQNVIAVEGQCIYRCYTA